MNVLYTGLIGTDNDPGKMRRVFEDEGLQTASIMTMMYVQIAADMEAAGLRLSLPKGFPDGWSEDEEHGHTHGDENDLIEMSSSMLTLTISKLQRSVSSTFGRIGFDNVLEHVISSNEIQSLTSTGNLSPREILSIDIANLEKKIGIEVDGPGHFVCLIDKPDAPITGQFDDLGENRVNGPTILKHRLLTNLGWDIIHIPYWEYQDLGGNQDKETKYCQSLLK